MAKTVFAGVAVLCFVAVLAAEAGGIPREGKHTGMNVMGGTFQVVPLGKDQARGMYDVSGVCLGEGGLLHFASVRCIGGMTILNGAWDDEAGSCIYTRPDGDQAFSSYKASGKVGGEARGSWTYLGGTGKLAGLTGSGEFTRQGARPAAPGTSQSVSRTTGSYRLP